MNKLTETAETASFWHRSPDWFKALSSTPISVKKICSLKNALLCVYGGLSFIRWTMGYALRWLGGPTHSVRVEEDSYPLEPFWSAFFNSHVKLDNTQCSTRQPAAFFSFGYGTPLVLYSNIPEACKRLSLKAEPPGIGHYRECPLEWSSELRLKQDRKATLDLFKTIVEHNTHHR